ncbi:MAG: peptidoglycan recognition family protein [Gemmatimonadota bacterium]
MTHRPRLLLCLAALAAAACAPHPPAAPAPAEAPVPAPLPPAPPILARAAWGALPPSAPMRPHTIGRITVHHTAGLQRPERPLEAKLRALQEFSQSAAPLADGRVKQAWPDIPYHYYVDLEGRVAEARDTGYAGDSNTAYDPAGHLLIVLEGNFESEFATAPQMEALRRLVVWAAARWDVPASRIGDHNDFARTACPGRRLEGLLPGVAQLVRGR